MDQELKELMEKQLIELKKISNSTFEIESGVISNAPDIDDAIKTGKEDITRYFDRIHDNLSVFNNMLIAGFFVMIQLGENIPKWSILIPIANLAIFVWINYLMMEHSRAKSRIGDMPLEKIHTVWKNSDRATSYSLLTILSTAIVTGIFLAYLL